MFLAKRNLLGDTNLAERCSCLYRWPPCQRDKPEHTRHENAHTGAYALSAQRKGKRRHWHRNVSEHVHTHKSHTNNYISNSNVHTHTRLGSLTMKRVWNESRACCAVGRLLTHAWTPASGHGPLLWAGQRSLWGWWKTISRIISHSELSLAGASALQIEPLSSPRELILGYLLNALSSAAPRSVIYPDYICQLTLGALFCQLWCCQWLHKWSR